MKTIDVIGGLDRLLDAATEKFNTLCEENGYDPDDPVLTGKDEEEEEGGENGEGGEEGSSAPSDENSIPAVGNPEAVPPVEGGQIPQDAPIATPVEGGAAPINAEAPVNAEAPTAGAEGGEQQPQLTPEEEEQLKAAQAAQ